MCIYAMERLEVNASYPPLLLSTYSETGSLTVPFRLEWLANKSQGSVHVSTLQHWGYRYAPLYLILCMCQGSEFRFSCLLSKALYQLNPLSRPLCYGF